MPGVLCWECFQKLLNSGRCSIPIQPLPWHGFSRQSTTSEIMICCFTLSRCAELHTSPERCRVLNLLLSIVLVLGAPITRYIYTIPYLMAIPLHLRHIIAAWRRGPSITRSKCFRYTLLVWFIGYGMPPIVAFAGPSEHISYGSFLVFTTLQSLWSLTR
jgi:hypothetical protein